MKQNLPKKIPVFPLNGVIYFPKTNLPLNIFEQRYLDLVNDAIKSDKLIGMIQERADSKVYNVGCLGKIDDFKKSADGRILVNLSGLTRFEILKEVENNKLYREFDVEYNRFDLDLKNLDINIDKQELTYFLNKAKKFFNKNGLLLNWKEFEKLDQYQQINTLAMIAPISNEEKQKMLETKTSEDKTKTLISIIDFYLHQKDNTRSTVQ